jgi:acetyl esterase
VSAVVSLSGVSVMTPTAMTVGQPTLAAQSLILTYLGCTSLQDCPQATAASPALAVDKSDAPMLLVNGSDELVPQEQARLMAKTLTAVKVPAPLVVVNGKSHGAALLDSAVRGDIQKFLDRYL